MRDRDVRIKREENTFGFNQEDVGAENSPVGIDHFHDFFKPHVLLVKSRDNTSIIWFTLW